jgi:hypothetical protein
MFDLNNCRVCRTCQSDETCVLCHDCYTHSNHEGHDVAFYHAQAGGCCDCGGKLLLCSFDRHELELAAHTTQFYPNF